jgi:uncharacterized membrane protein YjfL (UPF0719 family)
MAACENIVACHGYCMDVIECSYGDILTESAYIKTAFDWQNAIYLIIIFFAVLLSKVLFKKQYEYHIASSHEGVGHGASFRFAVLGHKVQGQAPQQSPARGTGFGGADEGVPPVPAGVALQQTKSRAAARSGTDAASTRQHFDAPKKFSDMHEPEELASPDPLSADEVTLEMQGETLWARNLKNPAMLVSLSAFLFSITSICAAAISDIAPEGQKGYFYVGWDTQSQSEGVKRRFESIGTSFAWMLIGVVLMSLSMLITRKINFGHLDLVGLVTGHTQKAKHEGYGMNVAAAVVEAGLVISSGLVAAGNVSGALRDWGGDILSVGIFFVLAQIAFILYTRLFDAFFIVGTIGEAVEQELAQGHEIPIPGRPDAPLKQGNVAVAISYACMMVSYAMILSNALYKSYELANFAVWSVGGGIVLLALRFLLDKFVAFGVNLDDAMHKEFNWGFACVVGAMQLSVSRVLGALIDDKCSAYVYTEGPGVTDKLQDAIAAAKASGGNATIPPGIEDTTLKIGDSLIQYQQMEDTFTWENLIGLSISFFVICLSKYTYQILYLMRRKCQFNLITQISDKDETTHNNAALAVSMSGYLFSVGTILSGLFKDLRQLGLSDSDNGPNDVQTKDQFAADILWVGIGIGMLLVVQIVNDVLVFHKYDNSKEMIEQHNIALAAVEAGMYIGSSFVIAACIQAETIALGLTLFGSALGLIVLFSFAYELMTKFDDRKAIMEKNVASGLNWGLNLVAIGLLLSRAIAMSNSIWVLLVWFGVGFALIFVYRLLIDTVVLPCAIFAQS